MELEIFKAYYSLLAVNLYIKGTPEEWLVVTNGLSNLRSHYGNNPLIDGLEIGVFKYLEEKTETRRLQQCTVLNLTGKPHTSSKLYSWYIRDECIKEKQIVLLRLLNPAANQKVLANGNL